MRLAEVMLVWVVVDKKFAFCRIKAHKDLSRLCNLSCINLEVISERLVRRHCSHLAVENLSVVRNNNLGIATDLSNVRCNMDVTGRVDVHIYSRLLITAVYVIEVTDTVPVSSKLLCLLRVDPAVVRLVVRICCSHELNIWSV